MQKVANILVSIVLLLIFNACAFDLVHVKQIPSPIETSQLSEGLFELLEEVKISLDTGYSRKLKKGSKWKFVGTLTYGDVYKTDDQILTIEASNIYEAYIVIESSKLIGFYLPVERSFSPLSNSKELKIKKI